MSLIFYQESVRKESLASSPSQVLS